MKEPYTLAEIADFDARKGFLRWVVPGTTVHLTGCRVAHADLWTNAAGELVTRFSSCRYVYHHKVRSKDGKRIGPADSDSVLEFIQHRLVTWVIGGVDDSAVNM